MAAVTFAEWYAVIGGVLGLMLGSAINAMVWRLYVGRSWVHGRSVCPDCGHQLAAVDLVPVLSWMALGGKCRYCGAPIKDHPMVEVVTAVAFAVSAYALTASGRLDAVTGSFWAVMLVLLLLLAVYDARWFILPDKVMLPLIVAAAGYGLVAALRAHSLVALAGALAAALVAGGAFYAIVAVSRGRAMGGGDIKLAFAMGLILGPVNTLVALLLAFNVAAAVGIVMIVLKRRTRKDQIPFGPYLVGATIVAFLFGPAIVEWYLRLNGLA